MNRLKSIFISLYFTLLFLGVVRAFWLLPESGYGVWMLVALVPGLAFFIWVFAFSIARTGYMSVVMWVGTLLACAGMLMNDVVAIEAWLWVLGVGLGFASLYIRWYSRYGKRFNMLLQNGNRLPELSFENPQGETVRLSDFDGPLLLLFYRGNWCPLCMAQIKEVAEQYNALAAKGLKLLMISPQSHANTAELARRFEVPMEFLVDKELKAAKTLGIEALVGLPAGLAVLGYDSDTVMPTVIITDAERRIIFTHQTDNYRVRPEPATFLRALADADI